MKGSGAEKYLKIGTNFGPAGILFKLTHNLFQIDFWSCRKKYPPHMIVYCVDLVFFYDNAFPHRPLEAMLIQYQNAYIIKNIYIKGG